MHPGVTAVLPFCAANSAYPPYPLVVVNVSRGGAHFPSDIAADEPVSGV